MKLSRRSLLALPAAVRPLFAAEVPRPAGDFEYFLAPGKPALISQYKGKVVILEFLFTT